MHVSGSGELGEMLWFLYAPFTVLEFNALAPIEAGSESGSAVDMTARVRHALTAVSAGQEAAATTPTRLPKSPAATPRPANMASMVCVWERECGDRHMNEALTADGLA